MRSLAISLALLLSALTVAHARCGGLGLTKPTPSCPCVGRVAQAHTAVWLTRPAKIIGRELIECGHEVEPPP